MKATRTMLEIVDHQLYSGNRVRELCIRRPPVNAFDVELLVMLNDGIIDASRSGIGALVLSGGDGVFSAGLDLKATATLSRGDMARAFAALRDVTLAIGRSEIPIAAAMTGSCLGAGAVFSLFCDYRVMNRRTGRFGITEVRGGLTVGRHVMHALARIVGDHRAQQLVLGAEVLDARAARAFGLADELAGPPFVVSRAVAWCDRALQLPRRAMSRTRMAARAGMHRILAEIEDEPVEHRVEEWFSEDVQAHLDRLMTR